MSKVKNLALAQYKSIGHAVDEMMQTSMVDINAGVYSQKGLDAALALLCANDIPHSYTLTAIPPHMQLYGIKSTLALSWEQQDGEHYYTAWTNIEVPEDAEYYVVFNTEEV